MRQRLQDLLSAFLFSDFVPDILRYFDGQHQPARLDGFAERKTQEASAPAEPLIANRNTNIIKELASPRCLQSSQKMPKRSKPNCCRANTVPLVIQQT